jgi:prepilin-type N-terminal cleavage/methylation domain-containing protein
LKRKGFTLIELMVVIAIIIILAAIAIPNYLNMTERAKKSRISSDMATLATGLESFKTDWGMYPATTGWEAVDGTGTNKVFFSELSGSGTGATINVTGATNAMGEQGPIVYLKAGTLTSIVDPFTNTGNGATNDPKSDGHIYYEGNANQWVLACYAPTTGTNGGKYMWRTDASSTVATGDTVSDVVTTP